MRAVLCYLLHHTLTNLNVHTEITETCCSLKNALAAGVNVPGASEGAELHILLWICARCSLFLSEWLKRHLRNKRNVHQTLGSLKAWLLESPRSLVKTA